MSEAFFHIHVNREDALPVYKAVVGVSTVLTGLAGIVNRTRILSSLGFSMQNLEQRSLKHALFQQKSFCMRTAQFFEIDTWGCF